MNLLFSSCDPPEVERTLKRLLWARIACGVGKDPVNSYLTVWIQRECDFRRAMTIFMHRSMSRPLPHWAAVLESFGSAKKRSTPAAANGLEGPRVVVVESKGATRTGTA